MCRGDHGGDRRSPKKLLILAQLIALDEDALVCDFAQTYHILDLYDLPVHTAATLAAGLKSDARVVMKAGGAQAPPLMIMLAHILDALRLLVWTKSRDATRGKNRPKSIAMTLIEKETNSDVVGFDSSQDFENERKRIMEAARNGN